MTGLKRGLVYFLGVIVFAIILYFGIRLEESIKVTYYSNGLMILLVYLIVPLVLGMLLALPGLFRKKQQSGIWSIDWVIVVAVSLPALVIAFLPFIHFYTAIGLVLPTGHLFTGDLMQVQFFYLSSIICGYSLISSLRKPED